MSSELNPHMRQFWSERLMRLYDEAKERHDGNSLSIYGEVSALCDQLEELEPTPAGVDLVQAANDLCGRLRRE